MDIKILQQELARGDELPAASELSIAIANLELARENEVFTPDEILHKKRCIGKALLSILLACNRAGLCAVDCIKVSRND